MATGGDFTQGNLSLCFSCNNIFCFILDRYPQCPSNIKKETTRNRSNLDLSVIRNAVSDIDNGKSIRATALEYGIDRNTLRNYLRDRTKLSKISEQGSQFKTAMIFTIEAEKAFVEYVLTCSKMNYGLTRQAAMKHIIRNILR